MRQQKGQSLVEMAIVTPILIFLLIGVFEVGWALRGYLVLTNANREAARFAVRQNYLNFNSDNIGYEKVWTHTLESISGQIDFNEATGAMIISYISVNAPCTLPFTITTPLNVPTYTWKYPPTATVQTQMNYALLGADLGRFQQAHSCDLVSRGMIPYSNDVVIVEMWYNQPQLLGFPLISNPFTDPVPMYGNSTFRKIPEARSQ